jgi:hypothetical protein
MGMVICIVSRRSDEQYAEAKRLLKEILTGIRASGMVVASFDPRNNVDGWGG